MLAFLSQPKKNRDEATRILAKYPDRVPVIVTKSANSTTTPEIDKHKYLVPVDLTMGQLQYVIRKRINLTPDKGLSLFINGGEIVPTGELVYVTYQRAVDKDDGFLHVIYSCESVFG